MRALRIGTEVIGVSPVRWSDPGKSWSAPRESTRSYVAMQPSIRFRTDTGVSGALPVTEDLPIAFGDAEPHEVGRYGTITSADGGSRIPVSLQSPEQVSAEWPGR